MTIYKPALWDESDPDYAPGIMYRGGYPIWRAPKRLVDAGYAVRYVKLPEGVKDDGLHRERAARCRDLTREMLRWLDGENARRPEPNTVKWLIGRYKSDEGSEYLGVKANTRQDYSAHLSYWEETVGEMKLSDLTFQAIMSIEAGMKKRGRSADFIHRKFTMLRSLAKHGVLIRADGARDLREVLSLIKFKMPSLRNVAPSRIQVLRVVGKARQAGYLSFAAGILMQFECALRAVDVRGQWLPADGCGGIVSNGRRWADGLTWEMVSSDLSGFTKVISKTKDSLPEPILFPLTSLPRLRAMLDALAPRESRVGPVFLSSTGLPYDKRTWAALWRKFAREGRVPDAIRCMDLRAGAISEADAMGASREKLSQAAQHTQIATTGRYVRNRGKAVAEVINLRQRRKSVESSLFDGVA